MGNTWITDITDFMLPDGSLPDGPAGRMARYFGSIVSAASVQPAGPWVDVAIRCRRRPGRRPCPGHIRLRSLDIPSHVEWHCTSCGDNGVISHWRGTRWDLKRQEERTPTEGAIQIRLNMEELVELRKILLLSPESQMVLDAALLVSGGALLRGTLEDLEAPELAEHIAAEADHERNNRRQAVLDGVMEKLELVVAEHGG